MIQQMKELPKWHLTQLELGRIYVECGYAAYRLGSYADAANYFRDAFIGFGHPLLLPYGLSYWLYGYMLWLIGGRNGEALMAWQQALDSTRQLEKRAGSTGGDLQFYKQIGDAMAAEIEKAVNSGAVRKETPPANINPSKPGCTPDSIGGTSPVTDGGTENRSAPRLGVSKPGSLQRNGRPNHALLKLFSVSDTLAGGLPSPVGRDPWVFADVEVDSVLINGTRFQIYSMNGATTLSFSDYRHLEAAQIAGDSMAKAGIEDGDYVLFDCALSPIDGDIAVIEFWEPVTDTTGKIYEPGATVKVIRNSTNSLILIPKSDNGNYQKIEFEGEQRKFIRLAGKVLAVLKPE
jgi:tetratricopeptide (TPR) repeat protein